MVPQHNNFDRSLTGIENLTFHAAYFGAGRRQRVARANELLEQFSLSDRAHDKVDKFSGGMMRRLLIARALMHAPRILFLDEPSTGLDPQSRLFLWGRIRALNSAGITIFLTTHDMEQAQSVDVCQRSTSYGASAAFPSHARELDFYWAILVSWRIYISRDAQLLETGHWLEDQAWRDQTSGEFCCDWLPGGHSL